MNRREFNLKTLIIGTGLLIGPSVPVWSKTYVTINQAKEILMPGLELEPFEVILTKEQMSSIKKASQTRVRNKKVKGFKSESGELLILDQVIGKHEFIDLAVSLDANGKVKGIEILKYIESYGYEIMNPKWLAQFNLKGSETVLKLDNQIKNISGATMSCRHVTDGVNRLTQTWEQVLKHHI